MQRPAYAAHGFNHLTLHLVLGEAATACVSARPTGITGDASR